MVVGTLKLSLSIPHSQSLKDKRSVVRRATSRVRAKFNVAAAEVGDNDHRTRALIGLSAVANDGPFVNSVLDKARAFLEDDLIGRAEVVDSKLELIHV